MSLSFFFFSSRRRHTRYWRDWSSDVCSSDLGPLGPDPLQLEVEPLAGHLVQRTERLVPQQDPRPHHQEDGRGACRGKGENSGGAGSLKKKKKKRLFARGVME